jgi:CRISPR-associated protein Cas2
MVYLFIYDISDKRRLIKVFHMLKKKGVRTQYSFFECSLKKREMLNLYSQIKEQLDEKKDKLFVIPINKSDSKNIIRIGKVPETIKGIF